MSDQTKAIVLTLVKTFVAAMLAQFIALGSDVWSVSGDGWRSILGAGVAALAMFAYNWASPGFPLYGNKAPAPDPNLRAGV